MNSSAPSGQVLSAGISVLPATGAYALMSQSQVESLYSAIVTIIGLWAISYVGVSLAMKAIKK